MYEDFKFLTRKEVEDLGAVGLIGTPMLRGYMHGFFMEIKLYNKLRAVSKPFEYEEHRKRKIREKIEAKRQSRIAAVKRLPKVNAALAEKLMSRHRPSSSKEEDSAGGTGAGGEGDHSASGLVDSRFSSLFERTEFQQDEDAEEYKLRNPVAGRFSSGAQRGDGGGGYGSDDELNDVYTHIDGMDVPRRHHQRSDADDDEDDEDDDGDYASDGYGEDGQYASDSNDEDDLEAISAKKQGVIDSDEEELVRGRGSAGRDRKRSRGMTGKPARHGDDGEDYDDSDDEEEGQIAKLTRRLQEKQQRKQHQHQHQHYSGRDSQDRMQWNPIQCDRPITKPVQ